MMIKFIEKIPNNMRSIVIYCHGFGDNKDRIYQHDKILNDNNIGIISFDLPCHGEDDTPYDKFNLDNCINYLKEIVNYSKKYNVDIYSIGSSFGGYVLLEYIRRYNDISKVFLKFPAVNFYECIKRKLNIDDNFNNKEYIELPNFKLYKESFKSFDSDLVNNFNTNSDIYIIHGDKDSTVLLSDVDNFSTHFNIKLKVIEGATHGMKDYLDLINEEIINYFK